MTTPDPNAKPAVTMDPPPVVPGKEPAAAPETVEVTVGDKTFKLSKEAAEAVTAMQAAATSKVSEYTKQISDLQAQITAAGKPPVKAAPQPGIDTDKMFTDPKAFIADLTAQIKGDVTASLTKAYNAATAERDFWDSFYGANPDLKANDFYVQAVLNREQATLGPLKVSEAITKLADIVKADLLKLAGKAPAGGGTGRPAAEAGTERTPARSQGGSEHSLTTDQPAPNSLTALLKQRREARRTGGKAAAK